MPTYDWLCEKCDLEYETIESIKERQGPYKCTQCGNQCIRSFKRCKFHFTGTKIEDAEFNPGLGQITKSKAHREELSKKLGVVEIGNDFKSADSVHEKFDSSRNEKLKKSWDEV